MSKYYLFSMSKYYLIKDNQVIQQNLIVHILFQPFLLRKRFLHVFQARNPFDSPIAKMADISTLNVARRTLRTTYLAEAKTNCL
jgi:hypothetical protein